MATAMTTDSLVNHLRDSHGLPHLDSETLLFSNGTLDSVSQLNLVLYIEKHAGFQISPMDLTLENFDSVDRIMTYVASRVRN